MKSLFLIFVIISALSLSVQAQPSGIVIYNFDNTPYVLNDTNSYIFILRTAKNCRNCFSELESSLIANNQSGKILACISFVDSNTLAKRMDQYEVQKLMPKVSTLLYQYYDIDNPNQRTDNFFTWYKTDITPAIIKWSKGRFEYLPYKMLFSGTEINANIVRDIMQP